MALAPTDRSVEVVTSKSTTGVEVNVVSVVPFISASTKFAVVDENLHTAALSNAGKRSDNNSYEYARRMPTMDTGPSDIARTVDSSGRPPWAGRRAV